MSLERGMLLYDKGDGRTVFVPWAQLILLTTPEPRSEGEQTEEEPATESRPQSPPFPTPSVPPAAPGNESKAGEAPPE
jgi:hypothetical protein